MIRKGVMFLLLAGVLLILASCVPGASLLTLSPQPRSYSDDMPYKGIIVGSYWQKWPYFDKYEYVEPNVLFLGIVRHDGPMMTHYYRFEIHVFHQRDSSLYVSSFKGIQHPHFLCGFCRFYPSNSRTNLHQFRGEFHGLVVKQLGSDNIYYIIKLSVNGTGIFVTQTGFEQQVMQEVLHHRHYIELRQFNGTRTPFYLSGSGLFYYYYMVPWGPHPWNNDSKFLSAQNR